jgi:hypothetical protein
MIMESMRCLFLYDKLHFASSDSSSVFLGQCWLVVLEQVDAASSDFCAKSACSFPRKSFNCKRPRSRTILFLFLVCL